MKFDHFGRPEYGLDCLICAIFVRPMNQSTSKTSIYYTARMIHLGELPLPARASIQKSAVGALHVLTEWRRRCEHPHLRGKGSPVPAGFLAG